jgi:2-oxoglutarate/2-oxoacid ferredoxin oxidoreductase subunit beta
VLLDVISPCVTFNDHEGSTKSYKYMQEHEEVIAEAGFVPFFEDIAVEYDPGTTFDVKMHDGSHLRLRKLHETYDPGDKVGAVKALMESHARGEVLTGVFYIETQRPNFIDLLNLTETPLAHLKEEQIRPPKSVLDEVMERLK